MNGFYQKLILEGTKCPKEIGPAVEELMRETYRTLDHLDRATFLREARKAFKLYQALPPEDQAALPRSVC